MTHQAGQEPIPTENYVNHVVLIEPDVYHLYWNYNTTDIVFELHVKQTGVSWIGFGLSRNGGMHDSVKKINGYYIFKISLFLLKKNILGRHSGYFWK